MTKKNWFLSVIILIAALLIAIVFWVYAKRIEHIENKMKRSQVDKTSTTLIMIPPTYQPICG